ncbi:MAG TPA: type 4a pilus biogenesis protein PilO [Gammaproteobacteria bacterium]|nr:type 4a pilus biogenesis protein PilO [Gammaproteobacteria bacterium]
MNIIEELQSLDTNDPGRWPLPFRVAAVVITFVAVIAFGVYMFVIKSDMPILARAQKQESDLRATFEQKQHKAANYNAYKAQLAEIQRSFGTMLRQLPGKTEVPSLLVDISQTGLGAGLKQKLFQPMGEIQKEFYAELPIKIRFTGTYHELGTFVSGVAALPRIVTLHDISIQPAGKSTDGELTLDVTAKTYRYLDEDAKGS